MMRNSENKIGPDQLSPRSPRKALRKISKLELVITPGNNLDTTKKSKELMDKLFQLLIKFIEWKIMNSQKLTENEKNDLKLELMYRQSEDENCFGATVILNSLSNEFASIQQQFYIFCSTQQVLVQLEQKMRHEEESSKIEQLIKQQQLYIKYIDSIAKVTTGYMLFWAQLQKEVPDMKAILSRATEIADLLIKVERQRDEIEKISIESAKINVIYALFVNRLLTDTAGAQYYRKKAWQSIEQRNRINQIDDVLEKNYGCNSDCGVAILTSLGEFEDCNREFVTIFGYSKSELRTIEGLNKLMPHCIGKYHQELMRNSIKKPAQDAEQMTKEVFVTGINSAGFIIPISVIRKIHISTELKLHYITLVKSCSNAGVYTDDSSLNIPRNRALMMVLSKNAKIIGINRIMLRALGFSTENTAIWRYNYSNTKLSVWPLFNIEHKLRLEPGTISYYDLNVDFGYLQKKLSRYLLDSIKDDSNFFIAQDDSLCEKIVIPMHVWFNTHFLEVKSEGNIKQIQYTICTLTFKEDIATNSLLFARIGTAQLEDYTPRRKKLKEFSEGPLLDEMASMSSSSSMTLDKSEGKIKEFKSTLSQKEGSWSSKLLFRGTLLFAFGFICLIITGTILHFMGVKNIESSTTLLNFEYERLRNLLNSVLALRIGRQHYFCEEPDISVIIPNRSNFYYSLVFLLESINYIVYKINRKFTYYSNPNRRIPTFPLL